MFGKRTVIPIVILLLVLASLVIGCFPQVNKDFQPLEEKLASAWLPSISEEIIMGRTPAETLLLRYAVSTVNGIGSVSYCRILHFPSQNLPGEEHDTLKGSMEELGKSTFYFPYHKRFKLTVNSHALIQIDYLAWYPAENNPLMTINQDFAFLYIKYNVDSWALIPLIFNTDNKEWRKID